MAWLVAGLEKVRAVDRGPWLPAVGSKTPTVYVIKLGSPNDFSFTKASTAGDPDFTWEVKKDSGEDACSFCRGWTTSGTAGAQLTSGHALLTTHAGLCSQDQVGPDAWKHDPHWVFTKDDMIDTTEF